MNILYHSGVPLWYIVLGIMTILVIHTIIPWNGILLGPENAGPETSGPRRWR